MIHVIRITYLDTFRNMALRFHPLHCRAKALERIAVARVAIVQRMEEWQSGNQGENGEATALQDALHSLRCLENILRKT